MTQARLAGLGAVVFGGLALVATFVQNSPGGTFHPSHVARYLESGHRAAVFVATYLAWIAVVGLLVLLAELRAAISDSRRAAIFWALCVSGAAAWTAGWAVSSIVPMTMAYGGSDVTVPDGVAYAISVGGWIVIAGGIVLIGCALLALTLGSSTLPAWVRWSTLVGAIAALAALAYFPFFLFCVWAVVVGAWLLVAQRDRAARPAPASAG